MWDRGIDELANVNSTSSATDLVFACHPIRDPGLVGMLGDGERRPHYGLIADGIHAHPNAIRMAWNVC